MAFYKTCVGSVTKCTKCGRPGVFSVQGKDYCQKCAEEEKIKESKKPKKQMPKK